MYRTQIPQVWINTQTDVDIRFPFHTFSATTRKIKDSQFKENLPAQNK